MRDKQQHHYHGHRVQVLLQVVVGHEVLEDLVQAVHQELLVVAEVNGLEEADPQVVPVEVEERQTGDHVNPEVEL